MWFPAFFSQTFRFYWSVKTLHTYSDQNIAYSSFRQYVKEWLQLIINIIMFYQLVFLQFYQ